MTNPLARRLLQVAVVSHREILARGLVAILADYPDRVLVKSLPGLHADASGLDAVLYDLDLLDASGPSSLTHLVAATEGRVIAVAGPGDGVHRQQAEELGVAGFLPSDVHAEELVGAIDLVATGGRLPRGEAEELAALSKREAEILSLICQGLSNEEIADRLFISANTLKSHIRRAYRKIGVSSRAQAVLRFTGGQVKA